MSESQKPDDRERFDHNAAIASGHLVSENSQGKIVPTGIGDDRYTVEGKVTNYPLIKQGQPLNWEELGWNSSAATPLRERAAEIAEQEAQEKKEAARELRQKLEQESSLREEPSKLNVNLLSPKQSEKN